MLTTPGLPLLAAAAVALVTACSAPAGVCGDHVVDPGEACDAADDGCDAACHLTGASAWTLTRGDADTTTELLDVAVDRGGQIVVLGVSSTLTHDPEHSAWLLGLDPDGVQKWQADLPLAAIQSYPLPPRMVVDDDGFIYIHGSTLQRFTPRGQPSWQSAPAPFGAVALAVVDDGVYAAGIEFFSDGTDAPERYTLAVLRHDAATGASVWARTFDDDVEATNAPVGVVVLGATVHVAGWHHAPPEDWPRPLHVTLDAATGASGPLVIDGAEEMWQGLAAGVDGDLVIVGEREDGAFVRRLAPDGAVRETHPLDLGDAVVTDLLVAGDDSIVVAGHHDAEPDAFIRGLTRAGEPAWSVAQAPADGGNVRLGGAAVGPGFLVAVGTDEHLDHRRTGWIRKIGPGPGTGGEDSTTGDTGDTTDGPVAPENVLECPQPPACGRVEAFSGCPGEQAPTAYTPNQACALGALASGDPVRIAQFEGCGDFIVGKVLLVRSDASAIVQRFETPIDGPAVKLEGDQVELAPFLASDLCTLKPPAFFTACLATFSQSCAAVSQWVEDCDSPAPAACEP